MIKETDIAIALINYLCTLYHFKDEDRGPGVHVIVHKEDGDDDDDDDDSQTDEEDDDGDHPE